LDIEISIVPSKPGKPMEIVQRKSKDAEMAQTMFVELESVAIPGWFDEDGDQVTSAVVVKGEAPESAKKTNAGFVSFEKAWWTSGAEDRGGLPYLTRSALVDYGKENGLEGTKQKRITDAVKPDLVSGSFIAPLIEAKLIEPHENGWLVIDPGTASGMMLKK